MTQLPAFPIKHQTWEDLGLTGGSCWFLQGSTETGKLAQWPYMFKDEETARIVATTLITSGYWHTVLINRTLKVMYPWPKMEAA